MDTPNTRSRKRSQAEGDVIVEWEHDSSLRTRVLEATRGYNPTPPTPTQQPRPISSNLSPSLTSSYQSTHPTASSSSTSTSKRKRPCRLSKSTTTYDLATPSSARSTSITIQNTGTGANDVNNSGNTEIEGINLNINELIGRAMRQFGISRQDSMSSESSGSASGSGSGGSASRVTGDGRQSSDTEQRGVFAADGSTGPCTRILKEIDTATNRPLISERNYADANKQKNTILESPSIKKFKQTCISQDVLPLIESPNPKPPPPAVTTSVGSVSNPPKTGFNKQAAFGRTHSTDRQPSAPFKTPFSTSQGVRSSPRRLGHGSGGITPKTGLRGSESTSSPLRMKTATSSIGNTSSVPARTGVSLGTLSKSNASIPFPEASYRESSTTTTTTTSHRGGPKSAAAHNANVDIGEDEGTGDNSFDSNGSFDDIFQEGGEEVMMIVGILDGDGSKPKTVRKTG